MAYARLFKRVRLAPGVTLNLSLHGPSVSLGAKGAHLTLAPSGIRRTVGLPGTGLFYTSRAGWHTGIHSAAHFRDATPSRAFEQAAARSPAVIVLLALGAFALGAALVILAFLVSR